MDERNATTFPALTGLVLAGGRSLRMGRDKAGLRLGDGRTLLEHAIGLLERAGCSAVLVSGNYRDHGGIPDRYTHLGPLGGIASVLEARPELSGPLLIVPVDMPALDPRDLRRLIEHGTHARFGHSPLPLVLTVDEVLRRIVDEQIEHGKLAVHALAARLDCARLDIDDPARLDNINTPEQWQRLSSESTDP